MNISFRPDLMHTDGRVIKGVVIAKSQLPSYAQIMQFAVYTSQLKIGLRLDACAACEKTLY